jgi:hypothetical protein
MYLQKVTSKKLTFFVIMKATDEKSRSQWCGSPDLYHNVTDQQLCSKVQFKKDASKRIID